MDDFDPRRIPTELALDLIVIALIRQADRCESGSTVQEECETLFGCLSKIGVTHRKLIASIRRVKAGMTVEVTP